MLNTFLKIFETLYQYFMQFGYAAWLSYNEAALVPADYVIGYNVYGEMISGTASPILYSGSINDIVNLFYNVFVGLWGRVGGFLADAVNWIIRIFGGPDFLPAGDIFGNVPRLIAVLIAIPLWLGVLSVVKILGKLLAAIPLV